MKYNRFLLILSFFSILQVGLMNAHSGKKALKAPWYKNSVLHKTIGLVSSLCVVGYSVYRYQIYTDWLSENPRPVVVPPVQKSAEEKTDTVENVKNVDSDDSSLHNTTINQVQERQETESGNDDGISDKEAISPGRVDMALTALAVSGASLVGLWGLGTTLFDIIFSNSISFH